MMKVTFDGVEFTKATQVAKQFGYTADYLGQLCRAKKVNARLVGRSWFINVPSLEAHRENKYQTGAKETFSKNLQTASVETSATPDTPSKKYLRRVPPPDAPRRRFVQTVGADGIPRHLSLRYEEDDHSLIPKVGDKPKVTLLKVKMAESESIPVTLSEKGTNTLAPEPLPDVALSGTLKVADIEGDFIEEASGESEKKEHSFKRDNNKNKLKIKQVETLESEKHTYKEPTTAETSTRVAQIPAQHSVTQEASLDIKAAAIAKNDSDSAPAHHIPVEDMKNKLEPVTIQFHIPAVGVALGVLVGALLLSAEQVVIVTDEVVNFAINFSWSNVANMALVLFTG